MRICESGRRHIVCRCDGSVRVWVRGEWSIWIEHPMNKTLNNRLLFVFGWNAERRRTKWTILNPKSIFAVGCFVFTSFRHRCSIELHPISIFKCDVVSTHFPWCCRGFSSILQCYYALWHTFSVCSHSHTHSFKTSHQLSGQKEETEINSNRLLLESLFGQTCSTFMANSM